MNKILKNISKEVFPLLQRLFSESLIILEVFNSTFPIMSQQIQLTCLYFFAFTQLIYHTCYTMVHLGGAPTLLLSSIPAINDFLNFPVFKLFCNTDLVFLMSYLILDFLVLKKNNNISKLMKYNLVIAFSFIMLQALTLGFWDLIFNQSIFDASYKLTKVNLGLLHLCFFSTFVLFSFLYAYFYIKSLFGLFATFPRLYWITNSAAFWARIPLSNQTPNMKNSN